jgi:hypothetical protein
MPPIPGNGRAGYLIVRHLPNSTASLESRRRFESRFSSSAREPAGELYPAKSTKIREELRLSPIQMD